MTATEVYERVRRRSGGGRPRWDRGIGGSNHTCRVERSCLTVGTAPAAVGASFDDVVKLTVYVVDRAPDKMPLFLEGVTRATAELGTTPMAPGTLIGVAALDVPDHLVEVEAAAVID
ncbi:RidA family protein [Streptomyces sp. NPDC051554]|uniref:RidA family protein n=1 Tax=Streptomyces sp. NPDC051554 TaxID=3365656 RepID=UPI00379E030F